MKKTLFLCNTVYQVFVALWIAHLYHKEDENDFLITDHMNGAEKLAQNAVKTALVSDAIFVERKETDKTVGYDSCFDSYQKRIHPKTELEKFHLTLSKKYDVLYIANFDGFSQSLFYPLKRRNRHLLLKMFEDGLSTYTTKFEGCYSACREPATPNKLSSRILKSLYPTYGIVGRIDECLLFSPELLQWNPGPVTKLPLIDAKDAEFKKIINRVFAYEEMTDIYDKDYLFMEEAYHADGREVGDVALIEELANRVGKDNIMIKIHPRNPENRFYELGYKTNENTSMPWEVIILNTPELNNKTLVTICSASVINPARLFGMNPKVYSLYDCLKPQALKGYESIIDVAKELFDRYGATQCTSIQHIT